MAVLYFDNLSRDTSDVFLAQGLTDAIITQLGEIERISVKSRFAVRRFRAATADPAAVARALGVNYVVTGSLQRGSGRLRVTAELARAASGDRVWGQAYERADGDVLSIQEDIARGIATGVAGRLQPAERAALRARPTRSGPAYDRLLRGDALLALRTPAAVRSAVVEYEAATRLDPALVSAWARMGIGYFIMVQRAWTPDGRPPADSLGARGIAAAERALALDSASSDAWMAHAYAQMVRHPMTWEGAEAGFRRAIALNPRNAEAWHQLADLLGPAGRAAEAQAAYREALAAEPGRPVTLLSLAAGLPPRDAAAACDSALAIDPAFVNAYYFRAMTRLAFGDTAGARADRASIERLTPAGAELLGRAQAARLTLALGDTAGARERARGLRADLPATGPVNGRIAGFFAGLLYDLGDSDGALDMFQRAPREALLWQYMGGRWAGDERFRRVFEAARPPWAGGQ